MIEDEGISFNTPSMTVMEEPIQVYWFSFLISPEIQKIDTNSTYIKEVMNRELNRLKDSVYFLGSPEIEVNDEVNSPYKRVYITVKAVDGRRIPPGIDISPDLIDRGGASIRYATLDRIPKPPPISPPRKWKIIEKGKLPV